MSDYEYDAEGRRRETWASIERRRRRMYHESIEDTVRSYGRLGPCTCEGQRPRCALCVDGGAEEND